MAKACIIAVVVLCVTTSLVEGNRPPRKTSTPRRFCDNPGGRDSCSGAFEICCAELNEIKGKPKAGICCASANACPDKNRMERGCVELTYLGIPYEYNIDARKTTRARRMCNNANEQDTCREREFCCPQKITLKGKTTNGICCASEAHCPDHSVDEWGCVTNPTGPRKTKSPETGCQDPGTQSNCAEDKVCCVESNPFNDPIQGPVNIPGICCAPGACPNRFRGEKGCLEVPVPNYNTTTVPPSQDSSAAATPPSTGQPNPVTPANITSTPPVPGLKVIAYPSLALPTQQTPPAPSQIPPVPPANSTAQIPPVPPANSTAQIPPGIPPSDSTGQNPPPVKSLKAISFPGQNPPVPSLTSTEQISPVPPSQVNPVPPSTPTSTKENPPPAPSPSLQVVPFPQNRK